LKKEKRVSIEHGSIHVLVIKSTILCPKTQQA
jgi:hypothetical protein